VGAFCVTIKIYISKYGKVRGDLKETEDLPRKGYRTICVTEEVYRRVQEMAQQTNRSIPEYIKYLMEKDAIQKEN
jgi:hypothetical protein